MGESKILFEMHESEKDTCILRVCQRLREIKFVEQFSDVFTRKITCKVEFIAVAC